jgi:membrane protein required for colicin V production
MTVLDYFVVIVVVVSVVWGASRGIIRGVMAVGATLAGLVIAAQAYPLAARLFTPFTSSARAANLLGFISLFLLVLVAGSMLARWLRRGVKRVHLGWLDTGLGAAFGLLRGWLICSVLYLALTAFPVKLEAVERASFAPALLEGTRVISYLTSRDVRQRFSDGYATIQGLWGQKG